MKENEAFDYNFSKDKEIYLIVKVVNKSLLK